jgi:hypothetical protein
MLGPVLVCATALLGVLLSGPAVVRADPVEERVMQHINKWNLLANCWGAENMIKYAVAQHQAIQFCGQVQAPLFPAVDALRPFPIGSNQLDALRTLLSNPALASLLQPQGYTPYFPDGSFGGRKRRAIADGGLLKPTEEDRRMFMEDYQDFMHTMKTKIGNLTCVMTQMKMLDAAGNINLRQYTEDAWVLIGQNGAAKDPAFVKKMKDAFTDCYAISQAWPQQNLDRHPLFKKYGRHMVFFTCAMKAENKMCAKYQIKEWLELLYGPIDANMFPETQGDKYDAAALGMKVLIHAQSPEEECVDEFFWGKTDL